MRVAVIGGTGAVGRHTVDALRRGGHEAVVVARSTGVDVSTGKGLDAALAGVDAVIDVTNIQAADAAAAREAFATATRNLVAAEHRAHVRHHVLLSIVGVDRIEGNPHYAGKRAQEEIVSSGAVPYTIQRATQFHEFAETVVAWTRQGDVATVPPALVQPVAAADVGEALAKIAADTPQQRAADLAGPVPEDLVDMARRTLFRRGEAFVRLVPSWRTGIYGVEAAGEVLLPGPGARLTPTTFEAWLGAQHPSGARAPAEPATRSAAKKAPPACRTVQASLVVQVEPGRTGPNPREGETTMRFMVMIKANKDSEAGVMPSEQMLTEMGKYNEDLVKAGVMLAGEGLQPSSKGARIRFSGKKRTVIDGPFTETKELVAGFWLIQVKSKEEAIEWVKRCPNPTGEEGEIEIRQVFETEDFGPELTPETRAAEERMRAELAKKK